MNGEIKEMVKEFLVTAAEMKEYDTNTIQRINIPQLVLMERAAISVAMHVYQYLNNITGEEKVLAVAGGGNNGADAVACARILKEYGVEVDIVVLQDNDNTNEPLKLQKEIAIKYGIPVYYELPDQEYEVIIDGIFGIGLNRNITGRNLDIINTLNRKRAYKVSIDIPSGIDATSGKILGTAFKADETITFGFIKRGLCLERGREFSGTIYKEKIGINELSFFGTKPKMFTYYGNIDSSHKIDLGRDPKGNKGTFGKVLIIAGRNDMGGACILSAKSALNSGCGMVSILTESGNKNAILETIPEAMIHSYETIQDIKEKLQDQMEWCDCIAMGPGMGKDDIAEYIVNKVLNQCKKPVILDADALSVLAVNTELFHKLETLQEDENTRKTLIFTPHLKEFSNLIHSEIEVIKKERLERCDEFTKKMYAVLVLKDFQTICYSQGKPYYLNLSGNDVLAKAGSGDILTGLIASFVAQYSKKEHIKEELEACKMDFAFYASCMAVYLHGIAGEMASREWNHSYCLASDIINQYYNIMQ